MTDTPSSQQPLASARWIRAHATKTVMAALEDGEPGSAARFVGGCVRNALLGAPVDDIDIATVLEPQTVMARLEAAGLKAVPTGLDHGTVTGIANGKPFEITTLRRDVDTDGRHASVAFTDDWAEDARRRDFTFNALYADRAGALYDPLGGLADLDAGRVRFIGDARARIREDYLRILRFFRMHAWYGRADLDPVGLEAIAAEREGLTGLSGERVHKELLRLLEADDPVPSVAAMADIGVLTIVLKEAGPLAPLAALVALERALMLPADGLRRLAALLYGYSRMPPGLGDRLRLSNAQRKTLAGRLGADWDAIAGADKAALKVLLYRCGVDRSADLALIAAAVTGRDADHVADALDVMRTWSVPVFPLTGRDVTGAGVEKGPRVGRILARLEDEWIAGGFKADRAALETRLKALAGEGFGQA